MTLNVHEPVPEGIHGEPYRANAWCCVPGCRRPSDDPHHLVTRSKAGKPYWWIRFADGTVRGNVVGMCRPHHNQITGDIGGYTAAIRWDEERKEFFWCRYTDGVYGWIAPIHPQPPSPEDSRADDTEQSQETAEVCPSCGQAKRRPRRASVAPGGARRRKSWKITVPDDDEDGAEVLDTLVDDLAPILGYESVPNTRYFVVARALAHAQLDKHRLVAERGA